jgi:hypothetical protein
MLKNFDGIIANCEPKTTSSWYKIGLEHGRDGREWNCRAASENAYALLDYNAGYAAGQAER